MSSHPHAPCRLHALRDGWGFRGKYMLRIANTLAVCAVLAGIPPRHAVSAPDVDTQIQTILKVEKEGAGHEAAVAALKTLSQQPATTLLPLLQAMDHANPLAENWLRGAFEAIADRTLKQSESLPKLELEQFALDRSHASQPR